MFYNSNWKIKIGTEYLMLATLQYVILWRMPPDGNKAQIQVLFEIILY